MEKAKQKKNIIKNFYRIEKFGSTKMFDKPDASDQASSESASNSSTPPP